MHRTFFDDSFRKELKLSKTPSTPLRKSPRIPKRVSTPVRKSPRTHKRVSTPVRKSPRTPERGSTPLRKSPRTHKRLAQELDMNVRKELDMLLKGTNQATITHKTTKIPKGTLKWKEGSYMANEDHIQFHQGPLPSNLLYLKTPYEFFEKMFPNTLVNKIADESNLFATQKDVNTTFSVTPDEIHKFIGISIYTSVMQTSNMSFVTLGELFDRPCDRPHLTNVKNVIAACFPSGWRDWSVLDRPEQLDLDSAALNKLRFAIPTLRLFDAFFPSSHVSERKQKFIRDELLSWPLGRALILAPAPTSIAIRGSEEKHVEFVKKTDAMRRLFLSRREANKLMSSLKAGEVCSSAPSETGAEEGDIEVAPRPPLPPPPPLPATVTSVPAESVQMGSRLSALEVSMSAIRSELSNMTAAFRATAPLPPLAPEDSSSSSPSDSEEEGDQYVSGNVPLVGSTFQESDP
ncbi:hypothetical protein WDU94_010815 [Cyamophila willieti]